MSLQSRIESLKMRHSSLEARIADEDGLTWITGIAGRNR